MLSIQIFIGDSANGRHENKACRVSAHVFVTSYFFSTMQFLASLY